MATHEPILIDELFGELEISENERWMVVYTKPKREKKLAKYAAENGIHYFLPLVDSVRVYSDRKVTFTKPLFSGYIFVKCDFEKKKSLIRTGHTVTFIKVQNEEELIYELKQIYLGKTKGAELKQTEYFDKGTRVLITSGPFEGLTGVVKDQKNVKDVILKINVLRQAVAVHVSSNQLEFISEENEEE